MRPFPFNLTGPEFLWFFAAFGLCVAFLPLVRRRMRGANSPDPLPRITDPIQIATLRGGYKEAVRMLVVTLVDRGFLVQDGRTLATVAKNEGFLTNKLEIALFNYFKRDNHPSSVFKDAAVCIAGRTVEESLESLGLRAKRTQRLNECLLSIGAFGAVAVVRIVISGPPFGFLLFETLALIFVAVWVFTQGITGRVIF